MILQGNEAPLACPHHPFVSIVVCTLGNRSSLKGCLDSLQRLSCKHFEIIVVLNGTDGAKLRADIAGFPVRVLVEPRRGVSAARNTATAEAKGELIAFVDDDVLVHDNWLHEIIDGFRDHSVACVIGRVIPSVPNYIPALYESIFCGERAFTYWQEEPNWQGIQNVLDSKVAGFGCNMAFRKKFLIEHSLFPEDLGAGSIITSHDEAYMFIQVLRHGSRILHTPIATVTHFFSEQLPSEWKSRLRMVPARAMAFRLKLLVEMKGMRWSLLKYTFSRLPRKAHASFHRESIEEPRGVVRWGLYLAGFWIYLKSVTFQYRRGRKISVINGTAA